MFSSNKTLVRNKGFMPCLVYANTEKGMGTKNDNVYSVTVRVQNAGFRTYEKMMTTTVLLYHNKTLCRIMIRGLYYAKETDEIVFTMYLRSKSIAGKTFGMSDNHVFCAKLNELSELTIYVQ